MALKSYEELIKVDVRQYCEERDGFTYLNWAKCIELLRQNGATEVYWEPIPDPQTGSSLRKTDIEFKDKNNNTNRCYETRIKVVIDDKEYEMQTPVMNGANPVKDNSMSQQRVWNSMCRAFVKCVAIHQFKFGMGFLREANKLTVVPVQGMPGTTKEIGARYLIASVVVDQEPNALVDLLDLANKGENPRVTKAMLDSYIDSEEVDIDELMEKTKDFLSKANATKKAVKEILKEYEEQMAKKKAQEL